MYFMTCCIKQTLINTFEILHLPSTILCYRDRYMLTTYVLNCVSHWVGQRSTVPNTGHAAIAHHIKPEMIQ